MVPGRPAHSIRCATSMDVNRNRLGGMVCRSQTHRRSSMPEPPVRTHNAPCTEIVPAFRVAAGALEIHAQESHGTQPRGSRATLKASSDLLGNVNTFVRRFVARVGTMPNEPTTQGTAVTFQAARGVTRSRAPTPQTSDAHRIRVLPGGTYAKEIYAGATLVVLAVLAATGWATASARPAPEPGTAGAEPPDAYHFASNSVYTGSITGATALILIGLIAGGAVVGMLLYPPRPRRSSTDRDRANDDAAPPKREAPPGKHHAAVTPEGANRRDVCPQRSTRPRHPARSSRPSSRIRRCSSTSSTGR